MASDRIVVRGAREHNLKSIDLELPRDQLVVITGLSGSGKSSLAFDTIYAEGQRRYVESLSAYARQFLEQMEKPDVDSIEGLSPAISIEQKTTSKNPRSTVGTVTEIYDYLRVLFARLGIPHCPECGDVISAQTVQQMVDRVLTLPQGSRLGVLAPVVRGRKGEYRKLFFDLRRQGYVRVRVNGQLRELSEDIELTKTKKHTIEVVVDRLVVRDPIGSRLADSIETALRLADGVVQVEVTDGPAFLFSERLACARDGISFPEVSPRMFSFNNPYGACPQCGGLGTRYEVDPELVVPDSAKSLNDGALAPWAGQPGTIFKQTLKVLAKRHGFGLDTSWAKLSRKTRDVILLGEPDGAGFEGVLKLLERRYKETLSDETRADVERFMTERACPACRGSRLRPETRSIKIAGRSIADVVRFSIKEARQFFETLTLSERELMIGRRVLKEVRRAAGVPLAGRTRLPHPRPGVGHAGRAARGSASASPPRSARAWSACSTSSTSRRSGCTSGTTRGCSTRSSGCATWATPCSWWSTTRRPSAPPTTSSTSARGRASWAGTWWRWARRTRSWPTRTRSPASTSPGAQAIEVPKARRQGTGKFLTVHNPREHNLKGMDVRIPLGTFTAVTGVSGSGKSTLVNDILYRALASMLHRAQDRPGAHDRIEGAQHLDKVIDIDQSPIGRTPRSNPATYTGVFALIRALFARTPDARVRGYQPGRFSFNVKGGRCEACQGDGLVKIEMHFLPDVYVTCEVCKGKRYNRETLEVRYKGRNIAEVLDMTVAAALDFFAPVSPIKQKLQTLHDVGLDYIRLGQSATTLSGGEAQRVKLATELSRRATGRTLYILDEPTTGLHFADIRRLLEVLNQLVDQGNTVVIIEHNMDVIKTADWIVDLGPEGGHDGGRVIATGTPEDVATRAEESFTGLYLRKTFV